MVRMLLNAGNCEFDCWSGQTKDRCQRRWDLLLLCKKFDDLVHPGQFAKMINEFLIMLSVYTTSSTGN
jgi:hypothetical protein